MNQISTTILKLFASMLVMATKLHFLSLLKERDAILVMLRDQLLTYFPLPVNTPMASYSELPDGGYHYFGYYLNQKPAHYNWFAGLDVTFHEAAAALQNFCENRRIVRTQSNSGKIALIQQFRGPDRKHGLLESKQAVEKYFDQYITY